MTEQENLKMAFAWLRLIRCYTFNFPISKGKGRIFNFAKRFCRTFPPLASVPTKDGRKIRVGFRDWIDDRIYFLGTYETLSTEIARKYVKRGSVCLDVGANIGWYTTLFQSLCGEEGEVHSFEPVPSTFVELEQNVSLNRNWERVFLNNFGLGDEIRDAEIYLDPESPSAHASISTMVGAESFTFNIKIRTLDAYLSERRIEKVDLVKVDIEGFELMFLKGATHLFEQQTPPVILMEMSPETCRPFGYTPDDLMAYISRKADYEFFALYEGKRNLEKIKAFGEGREGCNVLCVPACLISLN